MQRTRNRETARQAGGRGKASQNLGRAVTKAIRKAKAETLFGIGVKLSVSEHFEEYDVVESAEDAKRAVTQLTGYDFIAATGRLGEEMQS